MAFSQETIDQAWRQAGGKCECSLRNCGHTGRCNKVLDPQNSTAGKKWHAHHVVSQEAGGSDGLSNCLILCVDCHENTRSYGG